LFFSSDGHLGLGGLDVFYSSNNRGSFSEPKNLGAPINSKMDDFAFTYFNSVDRGYVSSNRGENPLDDNIYEIRLIKPLDETNIIVSVTNAETNAPLANAEVLVYDDEDNQIGKLRTDASGKAEIVVISSIEYDVQANLADFESDSETATAEGDQMMINLALDPVEELIVKREVSFSNIVFEFDKSTIKPEAAFELDKIIETLKKYEDINVKIESYTDSRGPESYNQTLSEARAQSTMQYLIDKGIDANRLTAEGMGESNPINDCSGGCTEEQHEENRRSKFIIVE
jgi:outer membrane protein OmpA-like peptidoglycan-associated protein